MKQLLILLFSTQAWSQTLYVEPNVDIRSIPESKQEYLASKRALQIADQKGVRDEVMLYTRAFLEKKISVAEFEKALWQWSQSGWSEEERWILVDTFRKSSQDFESKSAWICRIDSSEKCNRNSFSILQLPSKLREYEGLILDGKPYHASTWDNLKISDSFYNWVFVSSKYKAISFRGTWKDLQKQQVSVDPFVQGTCDHPQAHAEIQNLESQMFYSANCIRPGLKPVVTEPSFYEKNKKSLWWAAGITLGLGLATSLQGKSIVIDKPGFM